MEAHSMHFQHLALAILAAAFWLPTLALVTLYFFRKLQLQERLQAIEHGADLSVDREATVARTRRSGIVCIAGGLGISAAALIIAAVAHEGLAPALVGQAVAVVPIAIGLGLLVDYRIARRELDRRPPIAAGRPEADAPR
jgi:hypothetical protein